MSTLLSHVDTVTFDLDDTLWDNKPVIKHAINVAEHHLNTQNPNGPLSTEALAVARQNVIDKQPLLAFDLTQLREALYTEALQSSGTSSSQASEIAAKATQLFMQERCKVTPFDTAIQMLEALHGSYRIGAISNGNCQFDRLAISRYFDFWITPLEAKAAKPDPEIYHYVANRFNLKPNNTLHIGDCLNNDINAANKAGYLTGWFNPEQQSVEHNATIEFHCLLDLPKSLTAN